MDSQQVYQDQSGRPYKKWFFVLLVFMVIVIGTGVYLLIQVRQNVETIGSGNGDSAVAPSGEVATTDDPFAGNPDASIVIVEFSDFQCPFCFQSFPIVREIINTYGNDIKFIYRDFPIDEIHPQAQKAAEAGECAQEQGKFWEMHDKMFINQNDLFVPSLKRYAAEIGLDVSTFSQCLDNGNFAAEVKQDFNDGLFAGVDGTPTFFINGRKFDGVVSVEVFSSTIEQLILLGS